MIGYNFFPFSATSGWNCSFTQSLDPRSFSALELPVFKVGKFGYDFPRVFVKLVSFSNPVDSFDWDLIVEFIFSMEKFLKKCLCVITVILGYSSEH